MVMFLVGATVEGIRFAFMIHLVGRPMCRNGWVALALPVLMIAPPQRNRSQPLAVNGALVRNPNLSSAAALRRDVSQAQPLGLEYEKV